MSKKEQSPDYLDPELVEHLLRAYMAGCFAITHADSARIDLEDTLLLDRANDILQSLAGGKLLGTVEEMHALVGEVAVTDVDDETLLRLLLVEAYNQGKWWGRMVLAGNKERIRRGVQEKQSGYFGPSSFEGSEQNYGNLFALRMMAAEILARISDQIFQEVHPGVQRKYRADNKLSPEAVLNREQQAACFTLARETMELVFDNLGKTLLSTYPPRQIRMAAENARDFITSLVHKKAG